MTKLHLATFLAVLMVGTAVLAQTKAQPAKVDVPAGLPF